MEFPFGQQSSRDFLWKKSSNFRSSLSEGSSRLYDSVIDTKNGLMGGISSKLDQVVKLAGGTEADQESADGAYYESGASAGQDASDAKPGSTVNGTVKQFQGGTSKETQSRRVKVPADATINFDEPLYSKPDTSASDFTADQFCKPSSDSVASRPVRPGGQPPIPPPPLRRNNPFLSDTTKAASFAAGQTTLADMHSMDGRRGKPVNFSRERPVVGTRPEPAPRRMISGTVPQADSSSLGSDLLPGIPRVPSAKDNTLLAPQQGEDLLAITPTSGEALPMPGISPMQVRFSENPYEEVYDDSDADSEATEGCDEIPEHGTYGAEAEYEEPMFRSGSIGSDLSWSSSMSADSQLDDISKECMEFMKDFVHKIFEASSPVTQADKAKFGELAQYGPGRLWFARYVTAQRVHNKRVEEHIFYSLVQFFAVALFECNESEDFGPAKTLMNMCFTFFYEIPQPTGPTYKHFLYSHLKDQSIWQSLRFWNAAFFDAVQHERARRPLPTSENAHQVRDDREYQENITFGQLGTFTCNMRAFGLGKELCLEFLRKQSTIANLRDEQVQMLRENVERWNDHQSFMH